MATKGAKTKSRRPLLYLLIPLGFLAIVAFMFLGGEVVEETTDSPMADEVEEAVE